MVEVPWARWAQRCTLWPVGLGGDLHLRRPFVVQDIFHPSIPWSSNGLHALTVQPWLPGIIVAHHPQDFLPLLTKMCGLEKEESELEIYEEIKSEPTVMVEPLVGGGGGVGVGVEVG